MKTQCINDWDLLNLGMKTWYPNDYVCVLFIGNVEEAAWKWVRNFLKENKDLEFYPSDYYALFFNTERAAIKFCNSVPDSEPYCVVYSKGILVHENT